MVQNIGLSNNNNIDEKNAIKKTIIPLPAPSTYSNGNAYGGNQSFVHSSNDLIRNSSSIVNDSSSYWSDSDGVTAGSSNSSSAHRKPGVVGLSNIGNTCFMNSGLQCLLSTPSISEFFLKAKLPTGPHPKSLLLLQNFQYIVKQAWCGPQPKLALHDFKNCLAVIHTQFKDSRQHDCQEFLALLLDSLHEQLKKWTEIQEASDGNDDNEVIGDSTGEDVCGSSTSETITSSSATASSSHINPIELSSSENCNDENELTSTSTTQTVSKVSEVRTPLLHHSSLKDHNVRRSNFEAKSKHQIKRVKGAQISFFNLPNFTPAGSLSNKSISSTPPKSIKENQWMAIKSPCTPLKSLFPRRRKKKCEDLDSPKCSKKKKLDTSDQQPEANCNSIKRDADLTDLATEKDQLSKTKINGVVKVSTHSCNGDVSDTTTSTVLEETEGLEKIKKETKKPHRPTKEEEAKRAATFWEEHINANNTVIAKTFQGLFKSTVICSTCDYVSVTYEPFMYLSLPFPRILERNLAIWFISMKNRRPKRIELTVGIMDSIMQVKQKLAQSIPEDFSEGTVCPDNLVMAEVCNYSVCSLIKNNTIVRKLNHNRNMYMYEVNDNFDERYESLWTPTSEFNSCVVDNSINGNSQFFGPWNYNETSHVDSSTKTSDDNHVVQSTQEENWDEDPIPPKTAQDQQQQQCVGAMNVETSEKENGTKSMQSPESDVVSSSVTDELPDNSSGNDGGGTTVEQSNTMQCIICLEDCPVTDMRQHIGCDCIICVNCLETSIKHYPPAPSSAGSGEDFDTVLSDCGNNELKCATCMKIVDGKDFVPYRNFGENGSPKLSMELVPIIFRNDPNPDANNNSSPTPNVFGYPWLIKIPSILPAQEFHDYIASINPFPQVESKVLIVGLDGKTCGQCPYGSSCHGCEFPRRGSVAIRPRTLIAISYIDLNQELLDSIKPTDMAVEENPFALSWLRTNEPNYDIHDCLRAFSEIENLDEQNPWFCPHCAKNQCATKSLTVCHFPDYLIVYLKRFVFMDHSSNKLNNKLKFPVNDLDLNEYIAEEFSGNSSDWKYDLYACICHFGSISSGHYTAYGKNPVSQEWHYFNDDIVSAQRPKDVEHSSGYVLFYARKGVQYDIPYKDKVRPLPGLVDFNNCLPRSSRPTHAVQPNSSITGEEPWEPEDQVTSSSAPFCQPSPVSCNFMGDQTMDEMSLSVGADSKNAC